MKRDDPVTNGLDANVGVEEPERPSSFVQPSNLLVVYSPRGGSGKTTVALNLAVASARRGVPVALLELSQFSVLPVYLRVPARGRGLGGVITLLEGGDEAEDLGGYLRRCAVPCPQASGPGSLHLIPAAPADQMDKLTLEGTASILSSLAGQFGWVIVDTGSDLCERSLAALTLASRVLLVLVPDVGCGWSLLQFRDLAGSLALPAERFGLVVNRLDADLGFNVGEFESLTGWPVLGRIPDAYRQVQGYANRGVPVAGKAGLPVARAFAALAEQCLGGRGQPARKAGWRLWG